MHLTHPTSILHPFLKLILFLFVCSVGSCQTQRSFGNSYKAKQTQPTSNTKSTYAYRPSVQSETKHTQKVEKELIFKDPERSFRGVWVATVANIDWPKNAKDPFEKMQADYIEILKFYKSLHFNAVVVQIRTAGDAFYPSELAPWSTYLSGKQGLAPSTELNPLQWLIDTTHAYGMDFHAWINPYRATMSLNTQALSETHDVFKHPNWFIPYGNKYYYNPGLPEVRAHLVAVVQELLNNYDIDGLHLDDYFYPYKISGQHFEDQSSYKAYGRGKSIEDWRRENIHTLISELSKTIKATKPNVSFGISPFGVWKNKDTDPKGSNTRAGQTTYEDLFADPLVWMEKGWIDYLAPQLYWSMNYELASHRVLVNWWVKQKSQSKIYIGYGPYKIFNNADSAWDQPNELASQITYGAAQKEIEGLLLFSAKSLMQPKLTDVVTGLKEGVFKDVVLPPLLSNNNKVDTFEWKAKFHQDKQGVYHLISKNNEVTKYIPYYMSPSKGIYEAGAIASTSSPLESHKEIHYIKGIYKNGQLSQAIPVTKLP